jgi:hypothetical protein
VRAAKWLAIALGAYVALVVAFECLVGFMGARQAERGVEPGEVWLVLTTTDADGSTKNTVVAGVESEGGSTSPPAIGPAAGTTGRSGTRTSSLLAATEDGPSCRAGHGEERERIARDYTLPWAIRALTGFPPRSFLRLDAR